jgi:hypothetical protein
MHLDVIPVRLAIEGFRVIATASATMSSRL